MRNLHWFTSSSGRIELQIDLEDVLECSCGGRDAEPSVDDALRKEYLKTQLEKIDAETLRNELEEYGAWDDEELSNHAMNIKRIVWLACGDISEELVQ